MKYALSNEFLTVEVDTLGAELTSVKAGGKERLWQNDNGSWAGHAPMLFPVCGNCAMRVDGKLYPMARHGFGRKKQYRVVESGADFIRFSLSDDEETREQYPYSFTLSVGYRLKGNAVALTVTVLNTDSREIFFSVGGHESFAVEEGEYFLKFPEKEQFISLKHDENGLLTGEEEWLGEGDILPVKWEQFVNSATKILKGLQSRSVRLCKADGTPVAQTDYPNYPYLLLWRPEGAKMLCIEPWLTLPDELNDARDIAQKGFAKLSPGEIFTSERILTYY